ncbi:MAG: transglycosylase SLT domain-containing protein [bacterium]
MDKERRQFLIEIAAIAGAAALDGFSLLRVSYAQETTKNIEPSTDLKDYPHITNIIPSKRIETYFPLIVKACSDPKKNYLSEIPFLIELDVCKIWKESLFEWDALSNSGAAGLQQLMEPTARVDLGLSIKSSSELDALTQAISEHSRLLSEIASKKQELYKIVESGNGDLTQENINLINKIRKQIKELEKKKDSDFETLKVAKNKYISKIRSMSMDELKDFDARFVPEIALPAGLDYVVKMIRECKKFFGGSIDMNVWRGLAAYNSGLKTTKTWSGMPFISQTVNYTRDIMLNLTRMLELKLAYSTNDTNVILETKRRFEQ